MAEVPTRLQQLDLAKSSLQTELREAHELDAERLRYDRYAAREEADETPRQVADAAAGSSKNVDDALGRSSLTLKACLGAVSGPMLELWRSAEDPEQSADCVDREPGDDEKVDAPSHFILTTLLNDHLLETVETVDRVRFGD